MASRVFVAAAIMFACVTMINVEGNVLKGFTKNEVGEGIKYTEFLQDDLQKIWAGLPLMAVSKDSLAYEQRETEEYMDLVEAFRAMTDDDKKEFLSVLEMINNGIITENSKLHNDKFDEINY